jgi:hypothetical protein
MSKDKIRELYEFFFKLADADGDGFVSGGEAASLFRKSGLSDEALRNIWSQVSQGQPNLNKSGFFTALGLIALVQAGREANLKELGVGKMLAPTFTGITPPGTQLSLLEPEVLNTARSPGSSLTTALNPPAVGSSTSSLPSASGNPASSMTSSSSSSSSVVVWAVPENQKPVSASHFSALDVNGQGMIGGGEAKDFFLKSNLPPSELAKIWALSDVNGDGKLSLPEFQIAFFLTQQRTNLVEIPSVLPPSLYESVGLSSPHIAAHASPANSPAHSAPSSKTNSLLEMPSHQSPSSSVGSIGVIMDGGAGGSSSSTSSVATSSANAPRGGDFRLTVRMDPAELRAAIEAEERSSGTSTSSYMPTSSGAPSSIPAHLQTTSPQSSDWIITPEMKATYDLYFAKADEMMSGYVSGPKARELFTKASLPNLILADIWALSDTNNDGQLDKAEFSLAMHLINLARRGVKPPSPQAGGLPLAMLESAGINPVYIESVRAAIAAKEAKEREAKEAQERKLRMEQEAREYQARMEREARENQLRMEQEAREQQARLEQEARERQLQAEREARERERLALEAQQRAAIEAQERALRLESERLEAASAKQQVISMLREKERMVRLLRAQQEANIAVATQLSKTDFEAEKMKQEVSSMEMEVEKSKIKGASIKEHSETLLRNLQAAQDDKATLEGLIQAKKMQYMTEAAALTKLEEQLKENTKALQHQLSDISSLTSSISSLQKANQEAAAARASRAFDPQVLQQKLLQEKIRQDFQESSRISIDEEKSFNARSASPARRAPEDTQKPGATAQGNDQLSSSTAFSDPFNPTSQDAAANTASWASFGGGSTSTSSNPSLPPTSLFADDFGTPKGGSSDARPNPSMAFEEENDWFGKVPSANGASLATSSPPKKRVVVIGSQPDFSSSKGEVPAYDATHSSTQNVDASSQEPAANTAASATLPDEDFFASSSGAPGAPTASLPLPDDDFFAPSAEDKPVEAASTQANGTGATSTNPFPTSTNPFPTSTNPFPTTEEDSKPSTASSPFPTSDDASFLAESSAVSAETSKAFDDLFADVPVASSPAGAEPAFSSPDDLFGPSSSTTTEPSTSNFRNAFDEKLFDD